MNPEAMLKLVRHWRKLYKDGKRASPYHFVDSELFEKCFPLLNFAPAIDVKGFAKQFRAGYDAECVRERATLLSKEAP